MPQGEMSELHWFQVSQSSLLKEGRNEEYWKSQRFLHGLN